MPARPPVIAYHLVWTAYGTWLPNDPRGSGSPAVSAGWLGDLGEVHLGRKRVQPARAVVREFYEHATPRLQHDVLSFDAAQRTAIADALADSIRTTAYTCYACAIMPDHLHLVIRKHRHCAEEMIANLQETTRSRLCAAGRVPETHPVWTRGGWKTFLSTPHDVMQKVRYVENNPPKEGLPRQSWSFVMKYDGWSFRGWRR